MKSLGVILLVFMLTVKVSAQSWNKSGNSGTTPPTDYVGTSDAQPLVIKANNTVGLTVNTDGTVTLPNGVYFSSDVFINGIRAGRGLGNSNTNTVFGTSAFNANTTGAYNIAIGMNALYYNTNGNHNTAIGVASLQGNTGGMYNVALGTNTLLNNTLGGYNTALGYATLQNNTTGGQNVAVGANALKGNTSGNYNLAMGGSALAENLTGTYNAGFGYTALTSNTSGGGNVAIGGMALRDNTTGNHNIAFGYSTLIASVAGDNNIAIGGTAGSTLTAGSNNIFMGYNIQPNVSTTASNQLNIGNWIYGNNGAIGIGIANPTASAKLDVSSSTQGFLAPRMSTTQKNAITTPAAGLMVYDNTLNAYNYYNGTSWQGMGSGSVSAQWTQTGSDISYSSGRVGIGTTSVNDVSYRLFVETGIRTRKVKVDVAVWPDYVFEKDYSLMSLEQVERFINEHKHLPGMPSAKEVGENGLNLGENQALLLQKIEELTLYVIELRKQTDKQEKVLEDQAKEIQDLKTQLKSK